MRLRSKAEQPYTPLPGFSEVRHGVWEPEGYVATPVEYQPRALLTPEDVAREYLRCSTSLPYFAFSACWSLHTDDPGGDPVYRRFPMYPHLLQFFKAAQRPSNLHVEKSRQMLMSWAWMAVFLWDILYHQSWGDLAVSETERKVDDGAWNSTTDSLFGKLRVLWASLPPHLQHPIEMTHLNVRCLKTGGYVKGASGGTGGGRGATYKRALLDEAAHIPRGESLFRAVHEAAKNGLALNSTPLGKGNVFARIRFQPRTTFKRLSLHWSMHPEKAKGLYCTCGWSSTDETGMTNAEEYAKHDCLPAPTADIVLRKMRSPWYDHATSDYTPAQVASEFDLSYEASMRGRVYEAFDERVHVRDHHNLPVPGGVLGAKRTNETELQYRTRYLRAVIDPNLPVICTWDFGVNDPTSLNLGQVLDERTMRIRWIDEFEDRDKSWDHYHKFVMGLWQPLVREITFKDIIHYGDPAGKGRDSNLTSWISNLRSFEDESKRIVVQYRESKPGEKLQWLDFIAEIIRKNEFEVMLWCSNLIDALGQYHFPLDREGNPVPGRYDPVHDEWSHSMDSMRYGYQFRFHNRLKNVLLNAPSVASILDDVKSMRGERTPMEF